MYHRRNKMKCQSDQKMISNILSGSQFS